MKRIVSFLGLTAAFVLTVVASPAFAQQDNTETDSQQEATDQQVAPPQDEAGDDAAKDRVRKPKRPRFQPRGPETRQKYHLERIEKLQDAMKEKLSLRPEQEEAIDAVFEEYSGTLEAREERHRGAGLNVQERAKVRELRDKLIQARKDGDKEALEELREKFRSLQRGRYPVQVMTGDQLISKLTDELDVEQVPAFRKIVKTMRIGGFPTGPTARLRKIARAVLRPDVGLPAEQRRAILKTIRKAQADVAEIEDDDEEKANQIVDKARAEVFEKLTPSQRDKVEAAVGTAKDPKPRPPRPKPRSDRQPDEAEDEQHDDEDEEHDDEDEEHDDEGD